METKSSPNRSLTATHFEHTCGYCGCVFRVDITWQMSFSYKSAQEPKTYSCPECARGSRIKTATEPRITLISKRSDGRSGPFRSSEEHETA